MTLFLTPGVTLSGPDWKICLKIGIQATNFGTRPVWDEQKYVLYFRLSCTPVLVGIYAVLKIGSQIVHTGSIKKRSQNPPERRGPEAVFADFSGKIVKNGGFYGPESVGSAETQKNSDF